MYFVARCGYLGAFNPPPAVCSYTASRYYCTFLAHVYMAFGAVMAVAPQLAVKAYLPSATVMAHVFPLIVLTKLSSATPAFHSGTATV